MNNSNSANPTGGDQFNSDGRVWNANAILDAVAADVSDAIARRDANSAGVVASNDTSAMIEMNDTGTLAMGDGDVSDAIARRDKNGAGAVASNETSAMIEMNDTGTLAMGDGDVSDAIARRDTNGAGAVASNETSAMIEMNDTGTLAMGDGDVSDAIARRDTNGAGAVASNDTSAMIEMNDTGTLAMGDGDVSDAIARRESPIGTSEVASNNITDGLYDPNVTGTADGFIANDLQNESNYISDAMSGADGSGVEAFSAVDDMGSVADTSTFEGLDSSLSFDILDI